MPSIILLFLIVLGLNLVPAFAPPTWMVLSYFGLKYPLQNTVLFALTGATAATIGRLLLAKFSRTILRKKLLSEDSRRNVDEIREKLKGRKTLTAGLILLYAFSPFPSNYLFLAYGLTTLELRTAAVPFFIGRFVSYSFFLLAGSAAAQRFDTDDGMDQPYLGTFYIVTQIVLLSLVWLFTRIDWGHLFEFKRLRWLRRTTPPADGSSDGV